MSRVPRSNPKRLNNTFNGKDSGVGANVTPFGVGANVTRVPFGPIQVLESQPRQLQIPTSEAELCGWCDSFPVPNI